MSRVVLDAIDHSHPLKGVAVLLQPLLPARAGRPSGQGSAR
ncbi:MULTISPECIES: hypothetical protein [Gammaproteobacteria]|nr:MULTISPECIES: hypothetical protein [Gammaproteobacteria]MBM7422973.1 hypothetical protein [Spongiibacter marinus]